MLGFLFHRKRKEVKAILTGRMNRTYIKQVDHRDRVTSRGGFCEVIWLIPYRRKPDFSQARPVVTRDICPEGLSMIDTEPTTDERFLVGLQGDHGPRFLLCTVQHSTSLGYGFYQIGLHSDEVFEVHPEDVKALQQRLEEFQEQPVPAEMAT